MSNSMEVVIKNNKADHFLKIFFIIGLYVMYLVSGVYEEKLYKGTYTDSSKSSEVRFEHPLVAIMINSIVCYFISSLFLFIL